MMIRHEWIALVALAMTGLLTTTSTAQFEADPCWYAEHQNPGAAFGISVASAGDVNNDGYDDVIVGAHEFDLAYVYMGRPGGPATTHSWSRSGQAGSDFGRSVAGAGDVNDDGYDDVIVGAPKWDNSQTDEGRAFLYLGGPTGLSTTPIWSAESNQAAAAFGHAVASAGDVNGDGHDDVIVGAPFWDNGQTSEGKAYVYLGTASGVQTTPDWTEESDAAQAQFGYSVACAGYLDDIFTFPPGPILSDVIVGAPGSTVDGMARAGAVFIHFNGNGVARDLTLVGTQAEAQFGRSVAGGGNDSVLGIDGDVIIGAPYYNNNEADEGRAYVYRAAEGPFGFVVLNLIWQKEVNQTGANFGTSVACAGRVNEDDPADGVIVGAAGYDGPLLDEGRIYVYRGTAAGPSATAYFSPDSDVQYANFGYSVALANSTRLIDGPDELLVGAPYLPPGTDEPEQTGGAAYLFCRVATAVEEDPEPAPASDLRLLALKPSPFILNMGVQEIEYDLSARGRVELAIYSAMGRPIVTLVEGIEGAGRHAITWNGRDATGATPGSGVYFVRLTNGNEVQSKKCVLIR